MRDLHNDIKVSLGITPQTQTNADTAIVSTIVDTANFDKTEFALILGTLTDANATLTVLVEDGDNSALSDNAAVADAFLLGVEAMGLQYDDDLKVGKIGYIGPKRYVRVTVTPSGNNSGDLPISGVWIQSGARVSPQSTQVV